VEVGRATDTVDVDDVIDEEDAVDCEGFSTGEPPNVLNSQWRTGSIHKGSQS
jgi:hypothetical protein